MPPDEAELLATQDHFGFPQPAPVEKDWYVVRAMSALQQAATDPFQRVFAGGTCLARAHRLLKRMSKDVDFKIVATDAAPVSKTGRRQQLRVLRDTLTRALLDSGIRVQP